MPGRKLSGYWKEGKYEPLNQTDKNGRRRVVALCKICNAILKNTTETRLITHRRLCTKRPESAKDSLAHSSHLNSKKDIITYDPKACMSFDGEVPSDADGIELITPDLDTRELPDNDSITEDKLNPLRSFPISSGFASSSELSTPSKPSAFQKRTLRSPENPSRKKVLITQRSVSNLSDFTTPEQKFKLDLSLGKFFFGCNIPFHVVDSKYFQEFLTELRPSYIIPSRQILSTTILNTVHNEIMENDKRNIGQLQESVLLIDELKDSSNNSKQVVTMLQTIDNKLCFLESYDFTSISDTEGELKKICEKSVELAKAKFGTEIYGVVSDNVKHMISMGRKSHLWYSTCSSHTGNLLAKDIINKKIAAKVKKVLVYFKNPDMEHLVVQHNGSKIKIPDETRWCSFRDAFSCFASNISIFKKISAKHTSPKMKPEIIQLINDEELLDWVEYLIEVSNPVCLLINKSQSISYSIADAAQDWLTLKLPEEFQEQLCRRKLTALNKYALAANYLHPGFRGKDMDANQLDEVEQFLLDCLDSNGLDSLQRFNSNEGIFEILRSKEVNKPRTFWSLAERRNKELANLANKLIRIPASSAQLEQLFSNWSHIHSLRGNRLRSTTSQKLLNTYCYYSLKINDNKNVEDEDISEYDYNYEL